LVLGAILFYIFDKSRFESKIIEKLSKLSYPVFFIHIIVLEVVWKYFPYNAVGKIAFDPIFFVLVLTVSFGATYLIHKIPHFSKLTG